MSRLSDNQLNFTVTVEETTTELICINGYWYKENPRTGEREKTEKKCSSDFPQKQIPPES